MIFFFSRLRETQPTSIDSGEVSAKRDEGRARLPSARPSRPRVQTPHAKWIGIDCAWDDPAESDVGSFPRLYLAATVIINSSGSRVRPRQAETETAAIALETDSPGTLGKSRISSEFRSVTGSLSRSYRTDDHRAPPALPTGTDPPLASRWRAGTKFGPAKSISARARFAEK